MTKIFKPVCLMVVLALVLSLGMVLVPAAQADKGDGSEGPGTIMVTNGIYTLSVENETGSSGVGTYTVSTGDDHPQPNQDVLYDGVAQDPWSSYLTVRDYNASKDYVSTSATPSSGFTVVNLDGYLDSVSEVGDEVTTTWTTAEGLTIEQVTAIEGTDLDDSRVRVTTTITNNSEGAIDVGIRYEWDLMIADSDDSWFRERNPDSDWIYTQISYEPPGFKMFETTNDPASPIFSVFGSVSQPATLTPPPTPPTRLVYASWEEAYDAAFDYTHAPGESIYGDSAVLYYWGVSGDATPITLSVGGSTSVTQYLFALPPGEEPMPEEEEEEAPPKIDVRARPTTMGEAPLTVGFAPNSTGGDIDPDGYRWRFGDGGTSREPRPTHTFYNEGIYTVELRVSGPGGEARDSVEIVVEATATPSKLAVRNLNITPVHAQPRQAITISANIANEGGIWGSQTVNLLINGQSEQSLGVGVSPGSASPVRFTVYKVEAGEYRVTIGDATGTFYVMEEAAAPQAARPFELLPTGVFGQLDTGGIIAIVVIGIILFGGAILAFLLAGRRT